MSASHRRLAPAPPKMPAMQRPRVTFFDLPAEMRIEIYKLALQNVTIHITPPSLLEGYKAPHALTRTSKQVRNEILPMIHSLCPIRCDITDFNFDGLLAWMARVPPSEEINLTKNENLTICFNASSQPPRSLDTLRKWLKMRADPHRPQANWKYIGPQPSSKVASDLRRRAKRMNEPGKQQEMLVILKAIGIPS